MISSGVPTDLGIYRIAFYLALASCTGAPDDAASADDATGSTCGSATVRQTIVGGTSAPVLFSIGPERTRAIVALSIPSDREFESPLLCTGMVVAARVVLTAKHCLDLDEDGTWDEEARPIAIVVGSPDSADAPRGSVDDVWLHPELDVALVESAWLDNPELALEPMPSNGVAPDDAWQATPVVLAGYGTTERLEPVALRFAVEEVVRIESDHIVVDGLGRSGACAGDSGGPLFGRTDDARIRLLGILDDGDPSCVGEDFYTRVDRLRDWEPFVRLVGDGSVVVAASCESLSSAGSCVRQQAMWCEDDEARVDDCAAAGLTCGWSRSFRGFRCVRPEDDACGGLGSYDRCDGDTVVSCREGSLVYRTCGDCGAVCAPWVDGAGAGCRQ